MQTKSRNLELECFWALWKVQSEAISTIPPEGQTEEWKALKPVSRQQMCQNGHKAVGKAYGNLGGKWEMGQESV
jgi:hypothetical protein